MTLMKITLTLLHLASQISFLQVLNAHTHTVVAPLSLSTTLHNGMVSVRMRCSCCLFLFWTSILAPVTRLAVTSGTSGNKKLLPATRQLSATFFFQGVSVAYFVLLTNFPVSATVFVVLFLPPDSRNVLVDVSNVVQGTNGLRKVLKIMYMPKWNTSEVNYLFDNFCIWQYCEFLFIHVWREAFKLVPFPPRLLTARYNSCL